MISSKRDPTRFAGTGLGRSSKDSKLSRILRSNGPDVSHPNTYRLDAAGSRQEELPTPPAQLKPLTQGRQKLHGHAMISALKASMTILYKGGQLFPHLQSAAEALLEVLESIKLTKRDSHELHTMVFDLQEWAMTLLDYLSTSQPERMSEGVQQFIRAIYEHAKCLQDTQQGAKVKQLVGSEHKLEVIEDCYRGVEAAFRRLQLDTALITWKTADDHLKESRLNGLSPAHDARYDSSFSTEVERGECLANTRVSVLEGIWVWIRGGIDAKIHWTNGMAGTGKTTIAYSVCVGLDEEKRLGASFFCSRASLECRDVSRVLPTIAYQLAQQFYPFRSTLCRILGEHPSIAQRNIPVQFEHLIRAPLLEVNHLLPTGLVIVIDALDECSNPRAVDVMLNVLFRHVADLPVRFFLTSRPEPSISNTMLAQEDQSRSILHLHNVEEQFVKADIETYLTVRLAKLQLSSDQIQQLADQAGILFIYAATVTRYLERSFGALVSARLQAILTRDPKGTSKMDKEIDRLYKTILDGALSDEDLERSEMELIKRVLWTVVCIKEPVTKRTLAILLEEDHKIISGALQPLQSVLHVSESNEVVSTLHASFPEFLLNARRSGAGLFCDEQTQNKYLVRRCFELMRQQLRFNICRLGTSFQFDRDVPDLGDRLKAYIPAELVYACRYWAEHMRILPPRAELLDCLDDFLRARLLFWMEVLNLHGWIINAPKILAEVYTRLGQGNGLSSMRKLVHDACSFAAAFAANPIRQSTPHIYISALPLIPKQSSVWKNYQQKTQGLVQVSGTLVDQRDRLAVWEAHCKLTAIAYSPDGSRIAIGTEDGEVHIWDAHTGTPFGSPFQTHAKAIRCVAFSPDGALVASGSADFTLRVSHTRSGILVGVPHEGHTGEIRTVAFSPDGARIASGSVDRTVRLWEVHKNSPTSKLLEGHTEDVSCVVFSPNSNFIASGSYDHRIRIWSAIDGAPFGSPLRGHTDYVNCVTFSPDGGYIASGSCDGTVRLWNFSTCSSIGRPFHHQVCVVQSVAFTPDGTRILSGLLDPRIEVWDIHSRTLVTSSSHLSNESDCHVTFSTDGTRMVAGSVGGIIQIWAVGIDTSTTASIPLHFHTKNIQAAALSADCTLVASGSGPQAYAVLVWDLHTGALVNGPFTGHTNGITALEFSPDCSLIASGSRDCTVRVWDVRNGTPIGNPLDDHTTAIDQIIFSPNGVYIASISSNDLVIRLWDVCHSTLVNSLQGHTDSISSIAFSPDGTCIVSGSADRTIRVWNLRGGSPPTTWFILYSSAIISVSFSPDGGRIVSSSVDGKVQVLDAQTGALVGRPFDNHSKQVASVGFYSSRVASVASGGTVDPSDTNTIKGRLSKVLCRKHSPDGNRIITASTFDDGQLQVLSASSKPQSAVSIPSVLQLDSQGWLVDPDSKSPVLWLPTELRSSYSCIVPSDTLLVLRAGSIHFRFSNLRIGESWGLCYSS